MMMVNMTCSLRPQKEKENISGCPHISTRLCHMVCGSNSQKDFRVMCEIWIMKHNEEPFKHYFNLETDFEIGIF